MHSLLVRLSILTLLLTLVCSCDSMKLFGEAEGRVLDSISGEPILEVYCFLPANSHETYTDSTGYYRLSIDWGACIFKCPDMIVEYSKDGYKSISVTNPDYSDIFLEREE